MSFEACVWSVGKMCCALAECAYGDVVADVALSKHRFINCSSSFSHPRDFNATLRP